MEDVTDKQIYLKSPTISRYQPYTSPPSRIIAPSPSPPGGRRLIPKNLSVRGQRVAPPHIALAVETGLIMKGGETALVLHCKGKIPKFGERPNMVMLYIDSVVVWFV